MTIQEIRKLRETEDKIEFKEAKRDFNFAGGSHVDPAERRKCVLGYVVALANEGGGLLIFGVKDKHPNEIVGTIFAEGKIGELEDEIYKRLSIRVKIEELFENGKRVLVFHIPSRPVGSTLKFEGIPLMRIGDSLCVMSDAEIFRILSEREPDFSATICEGLTFEDLDKDAIAVMKERYAIKQYPDEIIITNAGGFPPGVTKDNILTVNSRPRSKRLAEVLQKTGFIERSGQGVDKMFYLCLMESKPLPDFSHTDSSQVDLRLKAKIIDNAFYLFINKVQSQRNEEDKLNVFDLLTLDKVRQGVSTGLYEASVEKLQREGLIKSQSSADKKYVLGDLYYEIAQQPAYIKEYRVRDLQIVAGCFEKAKEVYMRNFVEAFDHLLTREQIKYLVSKLEDDKLIEKSGGGRSIKYSLHKNNAEEKSVFKYFITTLSK
jgi:predicted HTH transcriptional regulator